LRISFLATGNIALAMVGPSIPFDTRFNVQRGHQITTCGTIVEVMISKHVDPRKQPAAHNVEAVMSAEEAAAEHSEEAAAEHTEAHASSVVLRLANALVHEIGNGVVGDARGRC
jgi:hypothetical protein